MNTCGDCRYWDPPQQGEVGTCCAEPNTLERGKDRPACRHFAAREEAGVVELREGEARTKPKWPGITTKKEFGC